jgi:outer membrane receptor protein involved in Fe transport
LAQPGDDFVQLDLHAGYRFFRRKAELSVGILNLTGQDYRLNPLTTYSELPRERVFTARFSFRF